MKKCIGRVIMLAVFLFSVSYISAAEDDGWVSLFDGKSLKGWIPSPGGTWEVKDGVIVGMSAKSEKRHGVLFSEKEYSDFKVSIKYKSIKGNSGLYFRSARIKEETDVAGFQAEIDPNGKNAGGLYENWGRQWVIKPSKELIKKAFKKGEWNEMAVEAIGKNTTVYLNGIKTAELKNDKGRIKGYFGFQLHGTVEMHIEYKDIKIKELK